MDVSILAVRASQACVGAGVSANAVFLDFTPDDRRRRCFSREYFTSSAIIPKEVIYFLDRQIDREVVNRRSTYPDKQSLLFSGYLCGRQIQQSGCSTD